MVCSKTNTFQYVQERGEEFLALFPHRYDFIYAPHPNPQERPNWKSESRYPLSDRHLLKGEYLYGVRFESETQYYLIDIDRHSPYHPRNAPLALARLFAALEPLGITDHIACTSSDSDGLHIYFPIAKAFNSWKLAKAISIALENSGFKLKLGQLEIFPNPKAYTTDKTPSLFNAHRLPLQMGSYILDKQLQPINNSPTHFVRMWQSCQRRNVLNSRKIKTLLKKAKQISYQLSNNASKFLGDLNTEIEEGWTGYGQTNRLLGRITMRSFIFNHITDGGEPLEGKALINKIVSTAKVLPGYKDWCRHQHEIEERATEWARCIENSHYFAYGTARGKYKELSASNQVDNELNYNQQQAQETQTKITNAVQDLLEQGTLPDKATARFKSLLKYNIGGASLYRYRELWHPIELSAESENNYAESELQNTETEGACTEGASALRTPTSLLPQNDSNKLVGKGLGDPKTSAESAEGNNSAESAQAIRDRIRTQLADAQKARRSAQEASVPLVDKTATTSHRRTLQRMQEFLLSGEPILLIEVGHWLVKQPSERRSELASHGDCELRELILDLAQIAECLVQMNVSPWLVRAELEEVYQKSLILDLTAFERQCWLSSLIQRL
ncbi:hypothetical protein S7335_1112 [Synechococcus sp. PCC 7335]|uniref:hypothetical protein n=1 Tax=Synechococcus sp. (strain ATCC 29403 / PCC 7335) TaxID=91464 RepID=UPI00017ECF2B|nr:hypothetical protein [Synechococcus sp. PCC 7335]EDX82809.1 hypothetical protein S7335_1112 [Synechococcus sp. PCC 7335]